MDVEDLDGRNLPANDNGCEYVDGAMVCPFGSIDGRPCSHHRYSGCSVD